MSSRTPQAPSAIALAWLRATSQHPLTPEARREWERFWSAHTRDDGWVDISIRDANLLATLGWSLAAQDRDWGAARDRAARCTTHPDWSSLDEISRQFVLSRIAAGNLLLGDYSVAIAGYRELLAMRRPHHPAPTYLVRNDLFEFCREQAADEVAPEALATLLAEVVAEMPGCKRLAKSFVPGEVTFDELRQILERTYPEVPARKSGRR